MARSCRVAGTEIVFTRAIVHIELFKQRVIWLKKLVVMFKGKARLSRASRESVLLYFESMKNWHWSFRSVTSSNPFWNTARHWVVIAQRNIQCKDWRRTSAVADFMESLQARTIQCYASRLHVFINYTATWSFTSAVFHLNFNYQVS